MKDQGVDRYVLEVCIASVEDAVAATQGGADRLELNVALELGGLTPTVGLLQQVKNATQLPVVVMLRPRPGNFYYSNEEILVMQHDAERLLAAGADGLVFGFLDDQLRLDRGKTSQFLDIASDGQKIFHRAFDCASDPIQSLSILAELGIDRILTSGQQPSAIDGIDCLKQLTQRTKEQHLSIEIMVGSGVRSQNVAQIIQQTHCQQVHGTFSVPYQSSSGPIASALCRRTCRDEVAKVRLILDQLSGHASL